MDVTLYPAKLRGSITPPPSKSQAHRLIIAAALSDGACEISNVAFSQDILATLDAMKQLGASWQQLGEDRILVCGIGGGTPLRGQDGLPHLDCGESGSTLRFLIPIALAVAGGGVFTGRGRLMERPQQPTSICLPRKALIIPWSRGCSPFAVSFPRGNMPCVVTCPASFSQDCCMRWHWRMGRASFVPPPLWKAAAIST